VRVPPFETRFPARTAHRWSRWIPVTEEFVCKRLAVETPDPHDLNDILIEMRKGTEAEAKGLIFRAVPITQEQP
jgi:hypothetical protein